MARRGVARIGEETGPYRLEPQLPRLPLTDNEPGALQALLKANKILRGHRWPAPYDRTYHEMILGDARDLAAIPSESVHLIVTSPHILISSDTLPMPAVGSSAE
jgi:hypothetical protein